MSSARKFETHDGILGKRVYSYNGDYLGNATDIEDDCLQVEKRIMGVGPIISRRIVELDDIDTIECKFITLKIQQDEYWQYPVDNEESFPGKYFIL